MPSSETITSEQLDAAAEASLQARRARREPMFYQRDGWMVLERPDGTIVPISKPGELKAEEILKRL